MLRNRLTATKQILLANSKRLSVQVSPRPGERPKVAPIFSPAQRAGWGAVLVALWRSATGESSVGWRARCRSAAALQAVRLALPRAKLGSERNDTTRFTRRIALGW